MSVTRAADRFFLARQRAVAKKARVEHTGLIFISADSAVLFASPRGIDLNVFRNLLREELLIRGRRCVQDRRSQPETDAHLERYDSCRDCPVLHCSENSYFRTTAHDIGTVSAETHRNTGPAR